MPSDPPLVAPADLIAAVQEIVSQVLMVSPARIHHDTKLSDLGAESIDYLDLIFRIEDTIGKKVSVRQWEAFINERLPGANLSHAITVAILVEFAERELQRA